MKKTLFALAAGAVVFGASAADGTFAASNIIGGVREYIYLSDIDRTLTKLPKERGAVQFVYNGAVVGAGTYGFLAAGTFSAGTISIPGQAGNSVAITVDVWDKASGATFDIATATLSQTVTITLGGAGSPPVTAAPLTGYTGGIMYTIYTPEPSTLALAAFGLGGLLFVIRRK